MTILEFKKEHGFSNQCIKFLYSEAKREYNLENYTLTMFIDSDKYHGMKYIYKIDFIHNNVVLMKEDILAKYSLFEKFDYF